MPGFLRAVSTAEMRALVGMPSRVGFRACSATSSSAGANRGSAKSAGRSALPPAALREQTGGLQRA
eukprot:1159416-Pelagomonas_calceolata.AAC.1